MRWLAVERAHLALAAAAGCAGILILAWLATYSSPGRWLDKAALHGFVNVGGGRVERLAEAVVRFGDPLPVAVFTSILIAVALLRARPRLVIAVPVILFAANVTTQVLKPLLPDDREAAALGIGASVNSGSWPSGHATASMSIALAAVIVAPPRLRPAVGVIGAAYAVAVSYSMLVLGWHFPSDVLAGFSVAAGWTALGVAALWATGDRWPMRPRAVRAAEWRHALVPAGIAAAGCAVLGALVFLARPEAVVYYTRAHTTFVAGAIAIAAIAAGIATAFALALRR